MHHLLNMGAEVNQRDQKGWTPLHRAAYLAHYNGYIELYEYLLVRTSITSWCALNPDTHLVGVRKIFELRYGCDWLEQQRVHALRQGNYSPCNVYMHLTLKLP